MFVNKKGFTLVELLAVIVILAIILAIAVPGISGIINSAKKGAFASDVKMLVTAIEYKVLEASTDPAKTMPVPGDITASIGNYGANPDNYVNVTIVSMNPVTINVESKSTSEFGAWHTDNATRTKVTPVEGSRP